MFTEEQIDKLNDIFSYLNSLCCQIYAQRECARDKSMTINELVDLLGNAAENIEAALEKNV